MQGTLFQKNHSYESTVKCKVSNVIKVTMLLFLLLFSGWYELTFDENNPPPYSFPTESYVSPGKRIIFIKEEENKKLFENCRLKPIKIINPKRNSLSTKSKCYIIEAAKGWNPVESNIKKLYDGFFFVENANKKQMDGLKNEKMILSIEEAGEIKEETRFTAGFLETGETNFSYKNGYLISQRQSLNLTGEGEVVGVVDTGIDYKHPMFRDEQELKLNEVNENHRKIVFYDAWKDGYDNAPGHGTHTASIIAGEAKCGNVMPMYNGIAPKSKIFFVDIQKTGMTAMYDDFDKQEFVDRLRSFGGGISSNSWGSQDGTLMTRVYDKVAYDNQDILFLFAAGNHYEQNTIDEPAASKNVLTVGASDALPGQKLEESEELYLESPDGTRYSLTPTSWSLPLWNVMQGEEPLYNYTKFATVSGNCDDALNEIKKGTKVIISTKFNTECKETKEATALVVSESDLAAIKQLSSATFYPSVSTDYSTEKASFSSGGPANSGMMKPEVIAPGVVLGPVSLSTSQEERPCNSSGLQRFQGTSEATPSVAGLATLLRQKLRSEGITPSSNLLRALIIAATDQETKTQDTGYGIPILSKVLTNTIYANNATISGNKHLIAKFKSSDKAPQVSLSWMDPQISSSAIYPLYSHIDIVLESPSGHLYYKNYEMFTTTKKLFADSAEEGEWTLHLISSPFNGTVNFAVAIVNAKGALTFSETDKCFPDCVGCSNGICQCNENEAGTKCSESVKVMKEGERSSIFNKYGARKLNMIRIPQELEKFDMNIRVDGASLVLIANNSYEPTNAFASFDTRDTETHTLSSKYYEELKAGNNMSLIIHQKKSYIKITVTFTDRSYPDQTPEPTVSPSPSIQRPPMRTVFPSAQTNEKEEGEKETPKSEEKWVTITTSTVFAVSAVSFIVLLIVVIVICKKSQKEDTTTNLSFLI